MRMFRRGIPQNQMAEGFHESLDRYLNQGGGSSDTPYWDPATRERYSLDESPPEGQMPQRMVTIPPFPDAREDDIIRRRSEIPDLDTPRRKMYLDHQGNYVEDDGGIDDEIWYDTSRGTSKPEKAYEFGSTPNYQPIANQRPTYQADPWVKKDQNPNWGKAPPMPRPRIKMGF